MSLPGERFATAGGWDSDDNVFPNYWRRRKPKDDAADFIAVTGVSGEVVSPGHDDIVAVLTVTCLSFGEIPDGWSSAVELMTVESLTDEYVRLSDDDRTAWAAAQAASAEAETKKVAKRVGPWRRF